MWSVYSQSMKNSTLSTLCFLSKGVSLLFNTLSKLVIAFLPSSKRTLISWLQSLSAVILEPKKINSVTISTVSPSICLKWWGCMPLSSFSEGWALSQLFHSPFTFIKRLFSCSLLPAIGWCHLHIWGYWYFCQQSWFQLVLHSAQHFSCIYVK